ncbi:MAG: DUF2007 domain-containing protein [Chloroflexi bacterium]|nr:DUF2007 domain-containing protein [Chloroflexota bacterium]
MNEHALQWFFSPADDAAGEHTGGGGGGGVGPVCIAEVDGIIRAQLVRSYLEDAGIPVHLAGEAVAGVYGLLQGPLSVVQVYVPTAVAEEARALLAELDLGDG